MEKYKTYRELQKKEGKGRDYQIHFRQGTSAIAVIAVHGGGIEPGTTEIADVVADDDHTFYSFEGLKREGNLDLHITSRRFDEPIGVAIVKNAKTVLAIHGCKGNERIVYIGGRNDLLKQHLRHRLEHTGFSVQKNPRFPGQSPLNICNRSRLGKGAQLEIPWGLRLDMFHDLARIHRKKLTKSFWFFVFALRDALSEYLTTDEDSFISKASIT
jgi:phage replication-related protein YjqB (UPF0714/DUF867 family)